jgi:hypothetical protein
MMNERDAKDLFAEWTEDLTQLSLLRRQMKDDDDCYLGHQWGDVQKKKNKPYLTINIVKKRIDWVSGFHRQNRHGMRTIPHEGQDDFRSDVYTQLLHLMYASRATAYQLDAAVDDCIKMGLGWFHVYMDYSRDILNGDIKICREDPFRVMFDPYTNSPDLSDCNHIFRRAYLSRSEAQALYPDYAKAISDMPVADESVLDTLTARQYGSQNNRINVLEKWYRETIRRPVAVNLDTMEQRPLEKGREQEFLQSVEDPSIYRIIEQRASVIKMVRAIGEDLIAYDGPSPYLEDEYPLIPIFWTFDPSCPDWHLKVQGMVRPLRDLQLEKNKRRSQLMEFILSKNIKGYKIRRGAGIDAAKFLTGDEQVIEVESMDDIDQFDGPKIPDAYMMLEKEGDRDFDMVSIPADMLGVPETNNDMAVGIAQLRQRANYTQIQHGLDNVWLGYELLSKQVIKLVNKFWDVKKIQRIVGENTPYEKERKDLEKQAIQIQQMPVPQGNPEAQMQFLQQGEQIMQQVQQLTEKIDGYWKEFDDGRGDIEWDVRFGDLQDTPSYRLANLATINEYKHQGHQVPDEITLEFFDIPKKTKERWLELNEQAAQAQQQQAQMAIQSEQMLEQIRAQVKIEVQRLANEGKIDVAEIKAKDVYESNIKIERDKVKLGDDKF